MHQNLIGLAHPGAAVVDNHGIQYGTAQMVEQSINQRKKTSNGASSLWCFRYPDINAGRDIEHWWHDSNYGKGLLIQAHCRADYLRIAAELLLPETLTNHRNLLLA